MAGHAVGQRLTRRNDGPLLTGRARFVDDLVRPGLLHAIVVRSSVAHGTVARVDATGVDPCVRVFGPDHFVGLVPSPVVWRIGDQWQVETPVVDRQVRYVGQPLALVVAPDRAAAQDAAEQVVVEIEAHEAVVDARAALAPGAPLLYPERGTNRLATFAVGSDAGCTDAVFAAADRVLRAEITTPRLSGAPLEGRAVLADPDPDGGPDGGRLTVWSSNQGPHIIRDDICRALALPRSRVRVVTPEVGGAFGLKDHAYPDELMVVAAAVALGRPVKWVEQRREALVASTQARDEHIELEVAYDDDGRLRALRVVATRNTGAHLSLFGGGPLFTMAGVLPGPYRWEAVRAVGHLVATNRPPLGAYRGFGQTQAALVRERAVDLVAGALGRDPLELRLQNALGPDELPHTTATSVTYDSGDYPTALRRAGAMAATWAAPGARQERAVRRGTGYCCYVQLTGIGNSTTNEAIGLSIGGYETAAVEMELDGSVQVRSGVSPHGQGLETTIPQLIADRLGIDVDHVRLVTGDTDVAPYSAYGTAASRSMVVGGGAAVLAAERVAERVRALAADMLEAAPADVVLEGGRARVVGTSVGVPIADVARRAWQGFRLPDGAQPGLAETVVHDPPAGTCSYAVHVCQVAVDPETGEVALERYGVVHDCGTIVNPTIVEGQIHGGIAQGVGSALLESIEHDADGQPLTTTLADYLLPVSSSLPEITIEHMETPSPFTPGGMKGMGEGGTNGAMGCVANAVAAALPEVADRLGALPLSPQVIWSALHDR